MKRKRLIPVTLALLMATLSMPAWARGSTLKQQLNMNGREFFGGVTLAGDTGNLSGTLQADNPKCILTIAQTFPGGFGNGDGPNGSIVYQGSSGCPGIFELFLLGTDGSASGLAGGTFAIVKSPDTTIQRNPTLGTTVEWAGNYTQVYNIDPNAGPNGFCGTLTFCADLGPNFGSETFNGSGLSYLLFLNGFTFKGPNQ